VLFYENKVTKLLIWKFPLFTICRLKWL